MEDKLKDFSLTLKKALQDYTGGRISLEDAKSKYRELLSLYHSMEGEMRPGPGGNIFAGMCHHHNIENFSLFTGVYILDNDGMRPFIASGDSMFNDHILSTHAAISASIVDGSVASVKPSSGRDFPHALYLYPLDLNEGPRAALIAVSSSQFFSTERFTHAGDVMKSILQKAASEFRPLYMNYQAEVRHEIERYINITRGLGEGTAISAHIFIFNMIEKIFSHMGISALLEISGEIVDHLKESFGPDSKIYALSLHEYVALTKSGSADGSAPLKKRIEFKYKGITIPFQTMKLEVDSRKALLDLWGEIFRVEQYVRSGDVVK
jgi:hypothetical protein